jgi:hypothetical protein
VICDGSGELAQIQLPGEKAGKALLEELKKLIPDAQFGKPGAQAPEEALRQKICSNGYFSPITAIMT